jgi:hypothetical protein
MYYTTYELFSATYLFRVTGSRMTDYLYFDKSGKPFSTN